METIRYQDGTEPEEPKLSRLREAIAPLTGKTADLTDKIGTGGFVFDYQVPYPTGQKSKYKSPENPNAYRINIYRTTRR